MSSQLAETARDPSGVTATSVTLATTDGKVAVWHLDICRRLGAFDADAPIVALAVAPDARTVIAGDDTGGVHFLRIERAADRRR